MVFRPLFNLSQVITVSPGPPQVFAWLAGILGTVMVFLTPLFQVPDEPNHAYRAYQVSEAVWVSEMRNGQVGGEVPSSLAEAGRTLYALNTDKTLRVRGSTLRHLLSQPLNPSTRYFAHFPNTALYSPLVYLPQALGFAAGRLLAVSAPTLCYMGRLCNLLAWAALVFLAIRITPVYKWLFMVLALLPMSLFVAASLSADAVTNGLSFLAIALFLKLGLDPRQDVGKWKILAMLVLTSLVSLTKSGYFPILILFLLIPAQKFSSKRRWIAVGCLLMGGALLALMTWATVGKMADYLQAFSTRLSPVPHVDSIKQMAFIRSDWVHYVGIMIHSLEIQFSNLTHHFIGVLGWLDVILPQWAVYFGFGVIGFFSLCEARLDINLTLGNKAILAVYAGLCAGLIMTSQFLIWTPVGATEINGLQGRYFIPFAPAIFALLYNRRVCRFTRNKDLPWIAITSVLILFAVAVIALIHRYYDRASLT
jgi:uncharacterized membrane protein